MTIVCDGLHTQVVKLDGQVPLLDSLASRRWRSMRLQHPNEWTKKGIMASLQAVVDGKTHDLGLTAPGAPKLDDVAAALAGFIGVLIICQASGGGLLGDGALLSGAAGHPRFSCCRDGRPRMGVQRLAAGQHPHTFASKTGHHKLKGKWSR